MTIVLLNADDVFGRGVGGTVEARPWAGSEPFIVVDGEQVTFAHSASVALRAGEPTRALEVKPTDGHYCIRWRLSNADNRSRLTRYTTIPNVPSVAFGDLIDVDPETFEPDESSVPAWEAAVADVRLAAEEAATSADRSEAARDAAAGSAADALESAREAEEAAAEAERLAAISVVVLPTEDPNVVSITVPSSIVINDDTAILLFATPEAS